MLVEQAIRGPAVVAGAQATIRDISMAYAAGRVSLEVYGNTVASIITSVCDTCGSAAWQYEYRGKDSIRYYCHSCYWRAFGDNGQRVIRSGKAIEGGYSLLQREMLRAFMHDWSCRAFIEAELALLGMCNVKQQCRAIVRGPEGSVFCGALTERSVCPKCGAAMHDSVRFWQQRLAQLDDIGEAENDSEAEAMFRQEVDGDGQ